MSARQSAEVQQAMRLHLEEGKSVYEAARAMAIWPSTLYRALKTKAKRDKKKKLDSRVA